MASYPIEIRRCRHIKTNGTQCGSPALKGKELCFYHEQNQTVPAELYDSGDRYCDSQIMLPPFEDAHSIQMVLRHIVQLMLQRRIDRKDAGLALYALQIASGNLKQMQAEKAKPTQVVVEPEKAGETPMGMTPWSASGQGHDPEDAEEDPDEPEPHPDYDSLTPEELYERLTWDERRWVRAKWRDKGIITEDDMENYLVFDGRDPIVAAIYRLRAEREQRAAEQQAESRDKASGDSEAPVGNDDVAGGTGDASCL
jgi:hypothetical protein